MCGQPGYVFGDFCLKGLLSILSFFVLIRVSILSIFALPTELWSHTLGARSIYLRYELNKLISLPIIWTVQHHNILF